MTMYQLAVIVVMAGLAWPLPLFASEEQATPAPDYNERLHDALGSEGGVQVYMDPEGNVGTILEPPGGERRVTTQPPQSPSINLGPPLQLHPPPSHLPKPAAPAQPPGSDSPQKTR